jgi:stress response protein YsnF
MQTTLSTDQLVEAQGTPVYSSDGDKIGSVEEIFVDEQTNQPEWIGIGTGFFGTKRVLVPATGAEMRDDGFSVPYTKDHVKETPDVDSDEISQETEATLYAHYGLGYSERRSDTGLPEGAPAERTGTATGEGDVVRSEEELRVGKRQTETGRARVRKWVETEPVQAEVELRRETARVTREPIDQPVSGAQLGEQEIDVTLRAEEPVVQKETMAKERITIEKDVEVERETVADEVRKERVDAEGDVGVTR